MYIEIFTIQSSTSCTPIITPMTAKAKAKKKNPTTKPRTTTICSPTFTPTNYCVLI